MRLSWLAVLFLSRRGLTIARILRSRLALVALPWLIARFIPGFVVDVFSHIIVPPRFIFPPSYFLIASFVA
jgi:hypothetical protein